MIEYEIAVLFHPDLEIDLTKPTAKIEQIVKEAGGKITKTDNWGKRKLAYPIVKADHAVYVFYSVDLPAKGVAKVESALNIADEVIRYLLTRPDQRAIAKAEAAKAEKAKKAAERGEDRDDDDSDDKEDRV